MKGIECNHCGNKFEAKAHNAKYCSNGCKRKQWRIDNREAYLAQKKKNRDKNREDINEKKRTWYKDNFKHTQEYRAKYNSLNKDAIREYEKKRYDEEPLFRLAHNLRTLTIQAFKAKSWRKNSATSEMLGAEYETVFKHLENQFTEGMSWTNKGEWHIDHIIPLASAINEDELYLLNHYTNLQPLWAKENQSKNDFYSEADKEAFLNQLLKKSK